MVVEITDDNDGLTIAHDGCPVSVLLIHGYGGSKEEMLPLGYRLALAGIGSLVIDLPGHGEADGLFDLESAKIAITMRLRAAPSIKMIIGHSLGARLALLFDLPAICVSPPLEFAFKGRRPELIKVLRPRRVREEATFSGLESVLIGTKEAPRDNASLVLYGGNDLKTVKEFAMVAGREGTPTVKIDFASHQDIITAAATCEMIVACINEGKASVEGRA